MINSNSHSHDELLEILEGYAAATPGGNDKEILDEWIASHPEYKSQLVDFAVSRSMLDFSDSAGFESHDEKQRFLTRTRETYSRFSKSRSAGFQSILKRASELELKKKELIDKLGISPLLLDSLESRTIEFATIPKSFLSRISMALRTSVEAVSLYLQQPPLAAGFHKNTTRPEEVRAVSFADAVTKDLMLSEEEKKGLLSLV